MAGRILRLDEAPKGDRLVVCGGRWYGRELYADNHPDTEARRRDSLRVEAERKVLFQVLDYLSPREIAQGDAAGADALAREWALERNVPCSRYPALWREEGRAAGPIRNRRMFKGFTPGGTVAFPGGRGTLDMENVTIDGGAYLVRVRFQYVFGMNVESFSILDRGRS